MPNLTGKTVLLTGASRGIGRETARLLGAAGAYVIAQYGQDAAGAQESVAAIPESRRLLLQADFNEPGSGQALWEQAKAWRGSIDVLISNAAVMPEASIEDPTDVWDSAWAQSLQVNTLQPAHLIRQAVPHFVERGGGTVVALSSWVTQRGAANPHLAAYAASKAALGALLKTVARNYAKDGVLAYTIAPGVVNTGMSVTSAQHQGGEEAVTSTLAMGEWVPAREVAQLIVFLSSGTCRHLTGATLDVNGASYIR